MNAVLRFLLMLLFLCGLGKYIYAQNGGTPRSGQALVDSLASELPKLKEDTNKVNLLNRLSEACGATNTNDGISYGTKALGLATTLKWEKGITLANNVVGRNYLKKSDYTQALAYFNTALKSAEASGSGENTATALANIGRVYYYEGEYPKGLEFDSKALKIAEELGDKHRIAGITMIISEIYANQSNYTKALEYGLRTLKLDEETGDKKEAAKALVDVGIVYFFLQDYTKTLEYYFKALKVDEELGDKAGVTNVTANIGGVYACQNDYSRALEYLFKAMKDGEEIGDKVLVAATAGNISDVFIDQKNYPMAITFARKEETMVKEIGDKHMAAEVLGHLGSAYLLLAKDDGSNSMKVKTELPGSDYKPDATIPSGKTARLHYAIDFLQRAVDSSKGIGALDVMQPAYEHLSEAYKIAGDYKSAMESYQKYTAIKDSVFSQDNEKKILKTALQNEYDRQHFADSVNSAAREKLIAIQLQRQRSYTYIGIAGVLLLMGFSFFMVRNNKLLGAEKKRSDDLLLNILPEEVANELKVKGQSEARHYEHVTVLFTDFVNFTQAGEKMTPQQLIDELHTCFKTFDEITARYNVEKIKTIGDAYLAVCGLPLPDAKHAEHMVSAAIEISRYMDARYAHLGNKTFEVRIGIHSGSAVAGIVGVKKFSYDIWGDTVNTAARMEQNSEPGKINISHTTYELIKDKFDCVYRGEIDAKNKGMLKMYFVNT